ncbi:hypothetical protein INT47_004309 [Mucor saturninus]|uniref:Zinc finger PHD-type domain-containing protein n=1 Tax=Mucor saturninus TaxID=64648 RepID=A0A8H7RAU7_9FUNG|nr:hypothetical protein INT47_004309 [Mucor saturninus]
MSDIMTSFNFMNQLQQHFLDQSELLYEPIMIYPDLPLVFTNTNKFDEIQNSYHTFNPNAIDLAEQEELELQKNLVKDVFFSPAMMDSCSQSDDGQSSVSDSSPTYGEEAPDQVLFFYGLDLSTEYEDGLGTTSTNRRTKQAVTATKKKHTKTCNGDLSKLLANSPKRPKKTSSISCSDLLQPESSQKNEYDESDNNAELMPNNKPRFICSPSIYQKLSKLNIDWCRYCGTTEGVNWRPGPWGKRTLCNKHGCDYKGYGFACKLPRLDLTSFTSETIDKRSRPVLQSFCSQCHCQESWKENVLVLCDGCPKAYHQNCYHDGSLTDQFIQSDSAWYCSMDCKENLRRKRVVVELPRKRLPLMRTPKNAIDPRLPR